MNITRDEYAALQLIVNQLSGYKNRNSREIGAQFDELPGKLWTIRRTSQPH
jgi:hypothetical protein